MATFVSLLCAFLLIGAVYSKEDECEHFHSTDDEFNCPDGQVLTERDGDSLACTRSDAVGNPGESRCFPVKKNHQCPKGWAIAGQACYKCCYPSYQGRDFYTGFMNNVDGILNHSPMLYFLSKVSVTVNIIIPLLNVNDTFTFNGLEQRSIDPSIVSTNDNSNVDNRGIYVHADKPITLYKFHNGQSVSQDMSLVLPVKGLGKNYIVQSDSIESYVNPFFEKHMFMIVSTEEDTEVNVTIGGTMSTYTVPRLGTIFRLGGSVHDGAEVTASKRVVVMSGHGCAFIVNGACDHVNEILYPEDTYGTKFVVANMYPRREYTVGFVAKEDGTTFNLADVLGNNLGTFSIDRGETKYFSYFNSESVSVQSDKPLMGVQYGHGGLGMPPYGDPSLMILPPVEKFGSRYLVYAPSFVSHVVLSVTTDDENNILITGGSSTIDNAFTATTTFGVYRVAYIDLVPGQTYEITHVNSGPFSAYMYGGSIDEEFAVCLGWRR